MVAGGGAGLKNSVSLTRGKDKIHGGSTLLECVGVKEIGHSEKACGWSHAPN